MPINFDCHRCGMPLEVSDDIAGGLAQCPHCEAVCKVPAALPQTGTEEAPEASERNEPRREPEELPPVATEKVPVEEAVPEAVAVSEPAPEPKPVPGLAFTLDPLEGSPKEPPLELPPEEPLDLPDEPPLELPPDEPPKPKTHFERDFDFHAEGPPPDPEVLTKPWERLGPPIQRKTMAQWRLFAQGCRTVKWGVLIEMIGIGLLFLMLEVRILDTNEVIRAPSDAKTPVAFLLPLLLPLTAGSAVIAVGRMMMLRVPPETGATAVLIVAGGFGWLRVFLLALSTMFAFLAAFESSSLAKEPHHDWAVRLLLIAGLVGWVAEISVIPGLAVVGGEMPDRPLRHRTALVTFALQLMAALWIAMIVGITYMDAARDMAPAPGTPTISTNPTNQLRPLEPSRRALVLTVALGVLFALQAGYAYLHYSLYAAGQHAGQVDSDEPL